MKSLDSYVKYIAVAVLTLLLLGCNGQQTQSDQPSETENTGQMDNANAQYSPNMEACLPDPSWLKNPQLPTEIASTDTFCDFYKFSLQSFIYFLSKNKDTQTWNFENIDKFPVYNYANTGASCTDKPNDLSVSINQAKGNAVIYDQNKNVVYYSVHFTRELCNAPKQGDLPVGTIELKMAWRIISDYDKSRYVNITRDLAITSADGQQRNLENVTLGLAGIHIIQSTKNHPEMMWGSYEHVDNNPDCQPKAYKSNFSFTSQACYRSLVKGHYTDPACNFNEAPETNNLTGGPTEICRVFPDGSDASNPLYYKNSQGVPYDENKYDLNIDAINQLNKAMTASNYFDSEPVLKNYYIAGGLWLNDVKEPSSVADNQRGSLELTNTLMETTVQGGDVSKSGDLLNCFDCHIYKPNETTTSGLSHIFKSIQSPKGIAHSFEGHK
ncbi:hypothetical protein [Litoribrevibacter albus]|uniref:Lipoprotein n=1 Tax=Litoribrevibacter albus TaxID=1473156 RepID=A0AA37S9Y4_9GAMM|nr:hypothetical protein [Litoribrevibacter albus]GLQ31086.1 hypothetical protein GCM10007876_15650 [Litoribrevibacter albus]